MSLGIIKNGQKQVISGLNTAGGQLLPSTSYYQTGYLNLSDLTNGFEDVTTLDIEHQSVQYKVVFNTPMPDTNFAVIVDVHNTNLQVEVASADKTVNGFVVTVRNLVATMRADRGETTDTFIYSLIDNYFNWQAFKLMTDEQTALDEQAIADIQAVIPSNASAANQAIIRSDLTSSVTSGSTAPVTSGGVYSALNTTTTGTITWSATRTGITISNATVRKIAPKTWFVSFVYDISSAYTGCDYTLGQISFNSNMRINGNAVYGVLSGKLYANTYLNDSDTMQLTAPCTFEVSNTWLFFGKQAGLSGVSSSGKIITLSSGTSRLSGIVFEA